MNRDITVKWQRVPNRFHYFREAVQACGETRILKFDETLGRHVRFAENVTKEQLAHLARVHEKVLTQGELESLWDWLEKADHGSPSERRAAWYVRGILMVCRDLAESGLTPFSRKQISPCRPTRPLQGIGVLARLPDDLSYLVAPAMKYGRYHAEEEMLAFLDRAMPEEMEELARIAERVLLNEHYPKVNQFLDRYEITDYPEAANLYFLFGVLDHADLQFDRAPDGPDT